MRIGIGFYKSSREIKDKLHKEKDKLAFDIFDYLSDHAEWKATTETVRNIIVDLKEGQLLTSRQQIEDYFCSWGEKVGNKAIRTRLEKLKKMGAIEIEDIKKGKQPIGKKVTVIHLHDQYRALEPQGIEPIGDQYNKNEGDQYSRLEPQGIEQNDDQYFEQNDQRNDQRNDQYSRLEPQGIEQNDDQRNDQPNDQPFLKNFKELKELKELKDLKQQQKIPQPESFVNTFAEIYSYFEKRINKRPTPVQIEMLEDFFDSGMQPDLLKAIMDKAGESATASAPKYFIDTCRELLKNHITTLDNWLQSAAKYKKRDQQQTKQNGQAQRQRTNMPRSDSNYQDLGF